MKQIKPLLLAITIVLALAACASSNDAPAASSPQTAPQAETVSEPEEETNEAAATGRVLVAWFSASGNTEAVGQVIADHLGADTYAITAQEPYTDEDLNWRDENSRSSQEHRDPSIRPVITGSVENMDEYSVILLGYPIWWGDAPMIVRGFLEGYELSGKTIIPFCTSSSSGFGSSGENLEPFAPGATWLEGRRFTSRPDSEDVTAWVDSLGLVNQE